MGGEWRDALTVWSPLHSTYEQWLSLLQSDIIIGQISFCLVQPFPARYSLFLSIILIPTKKTELFLLVYSSVWTEIFQTSTLCLLDTFSCNFQKFPEWSRSSESRKGYISLQCSRISDFLIPQSLTVCLSVNNRVQSLFYSSFLLASTSVFRRPLAILLLQKTRILFSLFVPAAFRWYCLVIVMGMLWNEFETACLHGWDKYFATSLSDLLDSERKQRIILAVVFSECEGFSSSFCRHVLRRKWVRI